MIKETSILDGLGLSADAIATRKDFIGGSDANTIMSGNAERLLSLWCQKRGEAGPDDLSGNLAVQMGSFTEPLNVAWYEKQSGEEVTGCGEVVTHPTVRYMRATLDGRVINPFGGKMVFEAKHTGTRSTDSELFERYVPQLTHNALCDEADGAVLSAFKGNGDWVMFEYDLDRAYADTLMEAEERFWECVRTGEPPVPLPSPPAPKPKGVKEYDMSGSNAWTVQAGTYRETMLAAESHNTAKAELKKLVPDDASQCSGAGIIIKRDKRGALRFTIEGE